MPCTVVVLGHDCSVSVCTAWFPVASAAAGEPALSPDSYSMLSIGVALANLRMSSLWTDGHGPSDRRRREPVRERSDAREGEARLSVAVGREGEPKPPKNGVLPARAGPGGTPLP